ncbi:phage major capsid protein [Methylibium sp.]|uniref:phage major capsid protein n=1 Tax=Methylibium sp. TaxID=2067992 RepID=UPI0025F4310E|nr:phage major capsid protein [Methylibium sp.]
MQNLQALREKIANLATQAKNLLAEKGSQTWSAEEQAKFDNFADEIERAKGQIKAEERMRELDADKFFNAAPSKKDEGQIDALAAVALYMRHGNNVTNEQAIAIRNAMSTTTTTEGGFTVPAEIAAMVVEAMKTTGAMRQIAEVFSTAGGNSLNFPTSDGTSEVGEIVAENAGATTGDMTFGTVAVNPYKYSSKKIALPWELISDSAIDVVSFVVNRLAMRLARITNTHYTTGTGTGQPFGVIARAATGKTGITGQTLTVIYDDLFDLKHSVNRAYRPGAKWMMNDLSVSIVSKLKDTQGRPIWEPGVTLGAPDMLLGHEVVTNDDVAVMAANAKSIAFGDFKKYMLRDVSGSVMMRRFDDSAFALNGQVGFCGWMRTGGNLVDVAAVKVYINSAT